LRLAEPVVSVNVAGEVLYNLAVEVSGFGPATLERELDRLFGMLPLGSCSVFSLKNHRSFSVQFLVAPHSIGASEQLQWGFGYIMFIT
jgi:hypothetical protein